MSDISVSDIVTWFDRHHISMIAMLVTVGLVIGALAVTALLKRPLQDALRRLAFRLRLPYETVQTITRALIGALWIIVAMLVLQVWGVSVGGLWTLMVSAATVVGVGFLATWTMISNITASFFIAFWRPFHLGDTIEIVPENLKGRVIDVNLMFVVLREGGGSTIQIPNNLFFQKMFRVSGSGDRTRFEQYESSAEAPRDRAVDTAGDALGAP